MDVYYDIMEHCLNASEPVLKYALQLKDAFNGFCKGYEAYQIALTAVLLTYVYIWLWDFLFSAEKSLVTRLKLHFFAWVRVLPPVKSKINSELAKTRNVLQLEFNKYDADKQFFRRLPEIGLTEDEILKQIESYKNMGHYNWEQGAVSGAVYSGNPAQAKMVGKVYESFAWTNPLHPDIFPGVRKMEAEIVRICCNLFKGDEKTCGTLTSGGTESILLACLAHRNRAYSKGIKRPEIVVPVTAHAAFYKAAECLKIVVKTVPINDITKKADLRAMKRTISSNTCMIVGSVPNFPYGTVDDIAEIATVGYKYDIPVHVDACLGGFLIVFMDEAGFVLAPFDFRVPGVTSISCDTHKYGYTTKGSSVVLYKNFDYLKHQFFCQPDWLGGIYATPTFAGTLFTPVFVYMYSRLPLTPEGPGFSSLYTTHITQFYASEAKMVFTIAGSRCGANIATTWASLMFHGHRSYVESTRAVITTTREIAYGLEQVDGIQLLGRPEVSVVGFTSTKYSIYEISDGLIARGWNLNVLQFPPAMHFCITKRQTASGVAARFLSDMNDIVQNLKQNPTDLKDSKTASFYGMAASIPDRSLVTEFANLYMQEYYNTFVEGASERSS